MEVTGGKDPFDLLMNAGSSPETWLLVGGPLVLLLVVVVIFAIYVARRRRLEKAELKRTMDSEAAMTGSEPPSLEPEDYDQGQAYEVPGDLAEPVTAETAEEREAARERRHLKVVPPPAATAAPSEVEEIRRMGRASWLGRLRSGLAKTRDALRGSLEGLFTGKTKIDATVLERLHEALYRADVGVATADKLVDHVRETLGKEEAADWAAVSKALKERARQILEAPGETPEVAPPSGPRVILIVGVNGVGKTTTIGKLAAHYLAGDQQVLMGAADTFRAAAIEQLSVWGGRLGVDVVKHQQGSDPAAVAYDSVKAAIARKMDVLLIDTAGRLHAKAELMAELGKINRVIGKDLPGAPHETWLVVDATTGQNAVAQVKAFSEVVKVTGLVVTKLDGTAKGGVILGIVDQFKLPVRWVGVGEKAADLRQFVPADYAESLF